MAALKSALQLPANQFERFYRGGPAIAVLRGVPSPGDRYPEDWVGSVTPAFGSASDGLTMLPDGRLLRDAIAAEPESFLGAAHVARFGADPGLLVKLLDAGERLPVHLHPDRDFARRELGSPYGKTEAWIVVSAEPGAVVQLGFRSDVSRETVADWVERQDVGAMLDSLHSLSVAAGDVVFVPAGTPHAIGQGVLILELQEPSDLSIMLESPPGVEPTLGLGRERALEAVDRRGLGEEKLHSLLRRERPLRPGVRAVLPEAADPFFRAEWIEPDPLAELDAGFSNVVVLEGGGTLVLEGGEEPLQRGSTVLVPAAAGPGELRGSLVAVRCRPPDPR
ncbi:MAG: class I mannose-6-phosphate isomerase [Thermoleophilaceae bacterium]